MRFIAYKPLRWQAIQFACPIGWKGCEDYYDGLVQLWAKDDSARFTLNGLGRMSITHVDATLVDLWTRNLGGKGVVYGEAKDAKFGKNSMRAVMAEGHGMLGKSEARFWYVVVDVAPNQKMLVIAALTDDASPERLNELIAALRSVYKA